MGQEAIGRGVSTCAHGGPYSVDNSLVKLDFSSSVNPLGMPARALRAIVKSARELSPKYPDPECHELRKSLAEYLGLGADWIIAGNGAVEIIYWFAQAFSGKKVVIPSPTFCEYELASQRSGASVSFVRMPEFSLDSDSVVKEVRGADALYLCNPNNPTGRLSTDQIVKILEAVPEQMMVLLDECFIELVDKPRNHTLIPRLREFTNLVILRSMTKSFGLAGLRVGYACSSPSNIEKLRRHRIPWNVNVLAQAAGVAALSDLGHLARARKVISKERKALRSKLSKLNSFVPLESDANFFMLNLRDRNSTTFRDTLLRKTGILVRDCSTFNGMDSRHVRIAVRTAPENQRLVKALEAFGSG